MRVFDVGSFGHYLIAGFLCFCLAVDFPAGTVVAHLILPRAPAKTERLTF